MARTAELRITQIAELSRQDLIDHLLTFDGDFRLDLTVDYLGSLSKEELRHLLLAACIHARKRSRN